MTTQQSESAKMKRNRLSTRNLMLVIVAVAVLVVAVVYASIHVLTATPPSTAPHITPLNPTANQTAITFDFDTGSPFLVEGQNTPLNQTSSGLTARFSSPSDLVTPAFSIQSYDTTFLVLSQFSGRWLYDNKPSRDSLDIKFSQHLTSINFTFATLEYHGGPTTEPSNITLTAYMNSTDTTPVGSATARGTFSSALYPQGTLSFTSGGQPFNLVRIWIPYQPRPVSVTDFFVDNIVITATPAPDTTSPVTTISLSGTLGNQGWYKSDVTITLSATDDMSGVNKIEYSFDNAVWTTYVTSLTLTAEGTTTVYYKSTDNAGNIEAVNVRAVKVDKSSPTTTINLSRVLGNGDWYTSTVTITLSASDGVSGVAKTEYSFDNVVWTIYLSSFTITSEGTSLVYCRSTDSAGNAETVKTQTVKIDKTRPTGSIVINNGDASTTSTSVTLTLISNDAWSGVSEVRYSNDGVWDTEQWETTSASKTWTFTAGYGIKTVYYRIKDNAGLISATYQDSITLEATQPPVSQASQLWIILAIMAIGMGVTAALFLKKRK